MRRTNWKTVSTLVTMVVIAGCQDNVVSAPQSMSAAPAAMVMAPPGSPQLLLAGMAAKPNDDVEFTVTEKGGVFLIGRHAVVFPSYSICDPAISSYGPGTWDSPCESLKGSVKIHASIRTAKLGTWIDFTPSLRFAPSKDVYLYLYNSSVVGVTDLTKFSILYAPAMGAVTVDESLNDSSLRTYIDARTGVSMRRIKHFSGYVGASGRACDPATESECYPAPDDRGGH
ncbi:MAG: hypothetical protein ABI969_10710 [bacterium]